MRANLFARLNDLEAARGDNLMTVHSLDSFYGVPGARPTTMTQAAFKARAARGLAGFYADHAAAMHGEPPAFPPLQREAVLGPSGDDDVPPPLHARPVESEAAPPRAVRALPTAVPYVPPPRPPYDPILAQSALDREAARLYEAYMAGTIMPTDLDAALHACAAGLLLTDLFPESATKDDIVIQLGEAAKGVRA